MILKSAHTTRLPIWCLEPRQRPQNLMFRCLFWVSLDLNVSNYPLNPCSAAKSLNHPAWTEAQIKKHTHTHPKARTSSSEAPPPFSSLPSAPRFRKEKRPDPGSMPGHLGQESLPQYLNACSLFPACGLHMAALSLLF